MDPDENKPKPIFTLSYYTQTEIHQSFVEALAILVGLVHRQARKPKSTELHVLYFYFS